MGAQASAGASRDAPKAESQIRRGRRPAASAASESLSLPSGGPARMKNENSGRLHACTPARCKHRRSPRAPLPAQSIPQRLLKLHNASPSQGTKSCQRHARSMSVDSCMTANGFLQAVGRVAPCWPGHCRPAAASFDNPGTSTTGNEESCQAK